MSTAALTHELGHLAGDAARGARVGRILREDASTYRAESDMWTHLSAGPREGVLVTASGLLTGAAAERLWPMVRAGVSERLALGNVLDRWTSPARDTRFWTSCAAHDRASFRLFQWNSKGVTIADMTHELRALLPCIWRALVEAKDAVPDLADQLAGLRVGEAMPVRGLHRIPAVAPSRVQ